MGASVKSLFRDTLSQLPNIEPSMFTPELPSLRRPTILIDLLYYVHIPTNSCANILTVRDDYEIYV